MEKDKISEILNSKVLNSNFELFKAQLAIFVKKEFRSCEDFIQKVLDCETTSELRQVARNNNESIAETLGFDTECDGDCDAAKKLKDEVGDLRWTLNQEEHKLRRLFPTLPDEMKYETFLAFKDKYNFLEFTHLMENGKKLINNEQK